MFAKKTTSLRDVRDAQRAINIEDAVTLYRRGVAKLNGNHKRIAEQTTDGVRYVLENVADKPGGVFRLKTLDAQRWVDFERSGSEGIFPSAAGLDPEQVAELAFEILERVLIEWMNDGQPDLHPERSMPIDLERLSLAIDAEGMQPSDQAMISKFVDAFRRTHPDRALTIAAVEAFAEELDAARQYAVEMSIARDRARLAGDPRLKDRIVELTAQTQGAAYVSQVFSYLCAAGELQRIAAGIHPGAGELLREAI